MDSDARSSAPDVATEAELVVKLAVVGLDSADWSLLDRWLHHLPHIAAIRREGISGHLATCKPPVTIPAWKCYATGKNPGKLGIYWFAHLDFDNRGLELNLPGQIPGNVWDLIPRSLVVNTPGTFPPRTIDGVLISGFPCPDGQPYATPPWILPRLNGYRANPKIPPRHPDFPGEAMDLMRLQLETFERLAPRFQFGQVTAFHIDELHHLYGSDSVVLDAWKMLDEAIGRIMKLADNVVLVSDHGSGPMRQFVNVVPFLEEAGLFRTRRDYGRAPASALQRMGHAVPARLREGLKDRWIFPKLADAVNMRSAPVHEWLPAASAQLRHRIDWSSSVIPLNAGLLFRNPKAKKRPELSDIFRCAEKMPGVARVWRRDELYAGPYAKAAPDLWVEAEPGVEFVARFDEPWERKDAERGDGWIVNHRPEGIFGFYGKDVDGQRFSRAQIYDMCPTILSFFGIPRPPDVDGNALPVWTGSHAMGEVVGHLGGRAG